MNYRSIRPACIAVLSLTASLSPSLRAENANEDRCICRDADVPPEIAAILESAVRNLCSEDFDEREQATRVLKKLPTCACRPLKRIMNDSVDTEVKSRLQYILDDIQRVEEDTITDSDRKYAEERIARSAHYFSTMQAIRVGAHFGGTLNIRYSGDRKIKLLEYTLTVKVEGVDKPVEHRLLFANKDGTVPPPESGKNSALMQVRLPGLSGTPKGAAELKLTYLEFERQRD